MYFVKTYAHFAGQLIWNFRMFYHILWYSCKNVTKGLSFREDVCTFWWPAHFGFSNVLSYFLIFLKNVTKGSSFREDVCVFWWPTQFGFSGVLSYCMIFLKNVAKGPSFREDVCTFWWPTLFGFSDVLSYFMIFLQERNKRVIISWRRIHVLVTDSSWIFGCFITFYDIPAKT